MQMQHRINGHRRINACEERFQTISRQAGNQNGIAVSIRRGSLLGRKPVNFVEHVQARAIRHT